jgi:hypothetical protein
MDDLAAHVVAALQVIRLDRRIGVHGISALDLDSHYLIGPARLRVRVFRKLPNLKHS